MGILAWMSALTPGSWSKPLFHMLACCLALFLLGAQPAWASESLRHAVQSGWEYRWGPSPRTPDGTFAWAQDEAPSPEWRHLGSLKEPPDRQGRREVWLRLKLPAGDWQGQVLFLPGVDQVFEMYAEGREVYHFGRVVPGRPFEAPGWRWHMIPIPASWAGKTLAMHCTSDDIGFIGPYQQGSVDTSDAHLLGMVSHDIELGVIAALSFFIGALSLFIYLGKKRPSEYLFFMVMAMFAGVYVLCRAQLKTVLFDDPRVWMRLEIGSLPFLALALTAHLRGILHVRFRGIMTGLAWACAGLAGLTFMLDLAGIWPLYNALLPLQIELAVVAVVVIIFSVWSAFDQLFDAKLVCAGLASAALVVLHDNLVTLKLLPWGHHLGHWAIFLLIVFLGLILLRGFIVTYYAVEGNLRDREASLTAIINALPDSILLTGRDGTLLEHHVRPEDNGLLLQEEVHDGNSRQVLRPFLAEPLQDLGSAPQTAGCRVFEAQLPNARQPRDFEVRVVEIAADRLLCLLRNITERKYMERMQTEFLSIVNHELRTPLTAIRGSLELLVLPQLGELSANQNKLVDLARQNSERLQYLVNELLDIQKIESGHLVLDLRPTELLPLVEKAVELNRPYADQYQVQLEIQPDLPDVILMADYGRMIQTLTNLISNAVKYSSAAGTVTLSAAVEAGMVRVSVHNEGKEIPEEFRARIFQKFAQADSSDAREKGGTGLGLSIVKAIVEQHGGRVGYTSERGAGTTFFFEVSEWREQVVPADQSQLPSGSPPAC